MIIRPLRALRWMRVTLRTPRPSDVLRAVVTRLLEASRGRFEEPLPPQDTWWCSVAGEHQWGGVTIPEIQEDVNTTTAPCDACGAPVQIYTDRNNRKV